MRRLYVSKMVLKFYGGKSSSNYVEVNECDGVRLLLGGPFGSLKETNVLSPLFPLPLQVPKIDEV
jgi:hypothetical protein